MIKTEIQNIKLRFGIIGNAEGLNRAIDIAMQVAPTDLSVLVTGESGVGKEFFPQIVHQNSARKHNKYIAVNCGAIPEGTIDSELFGHEKGSFTGAINDKVGAFVEANGGTLFLDEVGNLGYDVQVQLLRALQERRIRPVGATKEIEVDVRVVCATNENLLEAIENGTFREDLYHRLSVILIKVPPLRERAGDIAELVDYFVAQIAAEHNISPKRVDAAAMKALSAMPWSGNIRELRNVVERLMILGGSTISAEDVRLYC